MAIGSVAFFRPTGLYATPAVLKLLPSGANAPGFTPSGYSGDALAGLVQPNQRILMAGQFTVSASGSSNHFQLIRMQPMGALDVSFTNTQLPQYYVGSLALQADGGILMGGSFVNPLTGESTILARLLDPNVLAIAPTQAATPTVAYPVPAHDQLHLSLDAASRPRQVQLLDAQGRAVLTQPVAQAEMTLNTAALPPGLYMLRVDYGIGGPVTRRVVLE